MLHCLTTALPHTSPTSYITPEGTQLLLCAIFFKYFHFCERKTCAEEEIAWNY